MMKSLFKEEAETRGIIVRVSVSYLPEQSEPDRGRWFWTYHIRIENAGPLTVQLLTRHWLITDGRGGKHIVEGEGVVGEQPMIAPGASFDYVSGCPLATPTGHMQGTYQMVADDGKHFDAIIAPFRLAVPGALH